MKRWGYAITAFYAAVLLVLLIPGGALILFTDGKTLLELDAKTLQRALHLYLEFYQSWWGLGIYAAILVAGQALLLFLSVDTSWRHARPRQHIVVTAALASFFTVTLALSALFSIEVAVFGDKRPPPWEDKVDLFLNTLFGIWIGLWMIWGVVFYEYYRDASNAVSRAVAWLLRGSVLELLIAVPAHVIVRQRGDCSAPLVTGFGIVTGIAIMLLSFGPGVLALYKKRIDAYHRKRERCVEGGT